MLYSNSKRVDAERMSAEIIVLKDRILGYQEAVKNLQVSLESVKKTKEKQKKVTLVRSYSKKLDSKEGYKRYIGQATSFDFIEYGSRDTYELSLRIVRFPISDSSYECIVTNLPADEFPPKAHQEGLSRQMVENADVGIFPHMPTFYKCRYFGVGNVVLTAPFKAFDFLSAFLTIVIEQNL